jgi:hypothetical protein
MRWAPVALALLAGSCDTPYQPPRTASGQPEHTLSKVDVACFRGELLSFLVDRGYAIRQSSDTQVVAGRRAQSYTFTFPLGARWREERIMFTLIPLAGNAVRVILYGGYVSNPGTAFESITPIEGTANDTPGLAALLANVARICPVKSPVNVPRDYTP